MTEATTTDDALAASYLRDVTTVVDNDPRSRRFARDMALKAMETAYPAETDRARFVGTRVKDSITGYLTDAQQKDTPGRLLSAVLKRVSTTDLGFYYLEQAKEPGA